MKKVITTTAITALVISVVYFIILYRMSYSVAEGLEEKKNVTVKHLNQEFVLDVDAEFWKDIKQEKIHLYPQSARVPYGTTEKDVWVRAAYNDTELAFHLEFYDRTENRGAPENPDACAILFVPAEAPATAQMMGYNSKANVWQWLADRDAERFLKGNESIKAVRELVASGPGTQTPMKEQHVDGKGKYQDGKWSVVFKRKLKSHQDDEFGFQVGNDMNIAFAVWDGAKMESFSRKSISILRTLNWQE